MLEAIPYCCGFDNFFSKLQIKILDQSTGLRKSGFQNLNIEKKIQDHKSSLAELEMKVKKMEQAIEEKIDYMKSDF